MLNHAQSLFWNQAAEQRVTLYGLKVVEGDLVAIASADQPSNIDSTDAVDGWEVALDDTEENDSNPFADQTKPKVSNRDNADGRCCMNLSSCRELSYNCYEGLFNTVQQDASVLR